MSKFSIEPKSGFLEDVCSNIHKKERSLHEKRIILYFLILSLCALLVIPSLRLLIADMKSTGFLQFTSLIFSDASLIAKYWKSFVMVMAESLPLLSLAVFLVILLGMLQSVKHLVQDMKFIKKREA